VGARAARALRGAVPDALRATLRYVIERSQALAALRDSEFDVIVIGGGITGAGVALDAAARGLSVALIEQTDYAAGTSSRSSKLVHGGLRYLQNFDLGLVREALLERQLMVALAPHLVHPLPLVVPAFEGARPDRLVGVGLNLYDVMSVTDRRSVGDRLRARRGRRSRESRENEEQAALEDGAPRAGLAGSPEEGESWSPERHRVISGQEVLDLLPALAGREPTSGYLFYDCQTDDVRLVLTVLGEAERFGAVCANRVQALRLLERDGRACGVRALDRESDEQFDLAGASVVNATGVWADRLGDGAENGKQVPRISPSRGTHVLLRHEDLPLIGGAIVPAGDGRSIFALPWLGRTLVGTTDCDYQGELEHVRPTAEEIDYLLSAVNQFFATALTPGDLAGAFAGVRPLISAGDDPKRSVDISRKAELYETASGMLTITGGKLTTWRRMAKLTVDRMVERDARDAPCRTHEIPLGQALDPERLPRVQGVPADSYAALAGRYGHAAHEVLALADRREELARPIVPGMPDLLAGVALAARREQARTIGDVLLRRTRLGVLAARKLPVQSVAEVLAGELGWSRERTERESERFLAEAHAEGIDPAGARLEGAPSA
jgi:glycerol-3-phosphate dehydrogenase